MLFCLEILLQAYEKHTEKLNFFFSNFDLEYYAARKIILRLVSVSTVLSEQDTARDPISEAFFDQVALFSDFNHLFELLGPGFSPYSCNAFSVLE